LKKTGLLVWFLLCAVLLNACGAPSSPREQNVYLGAGDTATSVSPAQNAAPACDVDLVGLDVYQTFDAVFDIMDHAPEYEGKRIRMEGICDVYSYPDHVVYGCIVPNPTDDCQPQGMEFVLSDDYAAEDYPAVGDQIIICGEVNLYEMGQFTFCNLINCSLESVSKPDTHDSDR
jgi:hypothetical protein